MNKAELVTAVTEITGLSKQDTERAVDATFTAIENSLKGGDDVRLIGFGTFSVSRRAAGKGRNPRTGEQIDIAASNTPKFSAGKGLKDTVNG